MMTCSKCLRLNTVDARFCDWCGAYSGKASIPIPCTKCRTNNDPHAKFCSSCGCVIDTRLSNGSSVQASSRIASVS
jgi:RNA polymerase subunit RPABC4/transcription elongation factor Spt4